MNLRKDNCLYSLHADGIVSVDLDFKMQLSNSLFAPQISAPDQWNCPTWWSFTETGTSWKVPRGNKRCLEIFLRWKFRQWKLEKQFASEIAAPDQWNCPTWWSITGTSASLRVLRRNKRCLEIFLNQKFHWRKLEKQFTPQTSAPDQWSCPTGW